MGNGKDGNSGDGSPPNGENNVRPIVPGMPLPGPINPLAPMIDVFGIMGEGIAKMSNERDSTKGRAWQLICSMAQRGPVSETLIDHALQLAIYFDNRWAMHEEKLAAAEKVRAQEKTSERT